MMETLEDRLYEVARAANKADEDCPDGGPEWVEAFQRHSYALFARLTDAQAIEVTNAIRRLVMMEDWN